MSDDPKTQMKRLAGLWAEAYPHLHAYVLSLVRDFHDAEDLVQQAAERIADRFDQYDPARPFTPWAIRIARNLVIDHQRRGGRVSPMFDSDLLDRIEAAQSELHDELDASRSALRHCMAQLKDRARRILELYYGQSMPASQIAADLGITENVVWISQSRSRAALQDCIRRRIAGENQR